MYWPRNERTTDLGDRRSYSGASFQTPEEMEAHGSALTPAMFREMRPDTPEPEQEVNATSVEEMNETLFETARQESLRERMRELLGRHGVRADDAANADAEMDDQPGDQPDGPVLPRSPAPEPDELDENGRLTAQAKGKGRAN